MIVSEWQVHCLVGPMDQDSFGLFSHFVWSVSIIRFKCVIFNVFLQTISYAAERIVGTGSFGIVFQVSSHRIMHKLLSHYAYLLLIVQVMNLSYDIIGFMLHADCIFFVKELIIDYVREAHQTQLNRVRSRTNHCILTSLCKVWHVFYLSPMYTS